MRTLPPVAGVVTYEIVNFMPLTGDLLALGRGTANTTLMIRTTVAGSTTAPLTLGYVNEGICGDVAGNIYAAQTPAPSRQGGNLWIAVAGAFPPQFFAIGGRGLAPLPPFGGPTRGVMVARYDPTLFPGIWTSFLYQVFPPSPVGINFNTATAWGPGSPPPFNINFEIDRPIQIGHCSISGGRHWAVGRDLTSLAYSAWHFDTINNAVSCMGTLFIPSFLPLFSPGDGGFAMAAQLGCP